MKKILIVEDEQSLLDALHKKFAGEGYEILEAKNGKEGLEVSLKDHPDLILLDIVMPVMDGLTMLEKLRDDEWGEKAKIIVLTNLNDERQVTAASRENVHDYLVKSDWKLEDLAAKVKEKLN